MRRKKKIIGFWYLEYVDKKNCIPQKILRVKSIISGIS